MTLRRYSVLEPSAGTQWPPKVRRAIEERDRGCVGRIVGFPVECFGQLELDHVRASGGVGLKSRSTVDNGVRLCSNCHRYKTDHGKTTRPLLLHYLASIEDPHLAHVDPCSPECHP